MTATTVRTSDGLCVSDVTSTRLLAVEPDKSLLAAREFVARGGIHHLPIVVERVTTVPVVDEDMRIVGLVTDRDVVAAVAGGAGRPDRLDGAGDNPSGAPIVGRALARCSSWTLP